MKCPGCGGAIVRQRADGTTEVAFRRLVINKGGDVEVQCLTCKHCVAVAGAPELVKALRLAVRRAVLVRAPTPAGS